VARIEPVSRRVIVGPRDMLRTERLRLREVNWIGPGTLEGAAAEGSAVFAKVRSTQEPRPARLLPDPAGVCVELVQPEFG